MGRYRVLRGAAALMVTAALLASCGGDDDAGAPAASDAAGVPATGNTPSSTDGRDSASSDVTGSTGAGSGDDQHCTAERAGGELVHLTGSPNSGLDPTLMQGSAWFGGDLAGAFYGSVIRYDARTHTYEPWIAESWEANEDKSVWTLRLRDDVTFGNGDPFTTEHIAAHLERLAEAPVLGASQAALVTDIEIVDDYEMVVTLESPFDFRYIMSAEGGWVPNNNLVEKRGDRFHQNPVGAGAGAFEIEHISTSPGESIVMTAKDDWWGGPVCLDSIDFRYAADLDTMTQSVLNGDADTAFVGEQVQAAELDDAGMMAFQMPIGTQGYVTANQGFNDEQTAFDDVRIREALQIAIDHDVLYQRLFNGRGPKPTSALVPEGSPLYSGAEGAPYDLERARALVQETIDEGVWDGSFTFTHSSRPQYVDQAVLLEGMWEAAGMDVTLEPAEAASTKVIVERNFEVATLGYNIMLPAPWRSLNNVVCDSPRTRSGFCDPDMDAAVQELKVAVSMDEKREALASIQEVWNRTFPLAIYRHGMWGVAAAPHVRGIEVGADVVPYFDQAWIDEE